MGGAIRIIMNNAHAGQHVFLLSSERLSSDIKNIYGNKKLAAAALFALKCEPGWCPKLVGQESNT